LKNLKQKKRIILTIGEKMFSKKMSDHQVRKSKNLLIGSTGSVATIKLPNIISELKAKDPSVNVSFA
jgi:UDP-N-acetylglucosamine transferase subunit ALG13